MRAIPLNSVLPGKIHESRSNHGSTLSIRISTFRSPRVNNILQDPYFRSATAVISSECRKLCKSRSLVTATDSGGMADFDTNGHHAIVQPVQW